MAIKFFSFLEPYANLIGEVRGLPQADIDFLEEKFKIILPASYKEFISLFGKKCGNLLGSYYIEFPVLMENREDAVYSLNFDDRKSTEIKPEIKDSYFFFGQWQGYVFYFFDCAEENDNPQVYILTDSLKIEKYKNSFTEFIYDEGLKPLLENVQPF